MSGYENNAPPYTGIVKIFSVPSYRNVGHITKGVAPGDIWIDKVGNLYVANGFAANVSEYAPGERSPKCSYSLGGNFAAAVTTDGQNHVFVVGTERRRYLLRGFLYEFKQCGSLISQSEIRKNSQDDPPTGVAVDRSGNVFVEYWFEATQGRFVEFKRGGSRPTQLGAIIGSASGSSSSGSGGLVVDRHGNLIATDAFESIYRIRPPYDRAHALVSNLSYPTSVSLNKSETLLYCASPSGVTVYNYPSVMLVKTLHGVFKNGVAVGVAAAPDATF